MSSSVGKPVVMTVARRYLVQKGVEALRPQRMSEDSKKWFRPLISRRKAAVMRKAAIADGTFGSFDKTTGIGWDPQWDIDVYNARGNIPALRPPKGHKRERTRETRAQKIESHLAQADEKIETYRKELHAKKPDKGIETLYKRLMRGGKLK